MKLQIDTKEKTIGIVEDVTIQELNEFIRLAIPESEYGNWKIRVLFNIPLTTPIVIEKWKEKQWNEYYPWWENPYPTRHTDIWFGVNDPRTRDSISPQYVNTCFTVELK